MFVVSTRIPKELTGAYQYCQRLTRAHYENFPVASFLIPAAVRPHIAAVYAFARSADDFADELHDRDKLLDWQRQLHNCLHTPSENPIFRALAHTIQSFQLPVQLLDDLLTAFLQDLKINRYQTQEELLNYCRYSANPVGRIVLWLFGYRAEELFAYADSITSALQLTNFWQDISVDAKKNRIYIPREFQAQFGVKENQILEGIANQNTGRLILHLVQITGELYREGMPILKAMHGRLRWELKLTILGGMRILELVRRNRQRVLIKRPKLEKKDWGFIFSKALFNFG